MPTLAATASHSWASALSLSAKALPLTTPGTAPRSSANDCTSALAMAVAISLRSFSSTGSGVPLEAHRPVKLTTL